MAKDVEVVRSERLARFWDMFDWPDRWFEGMRPWIMGEGTLRIEQEVKDDSMVIRAEMPGIDPDKDVEITLSNSVLRIHAERKSETKEEEAGRTRSEFRYGSFERTLRVPEDVNVDDIKASYKDGILEVHVPYKVPTEAPPAQIPVTRS
jgi:HSP20 family protein